VRGIGAGAAGSAIRRSEADAVGEALPRPCGMVVLLNSEGDLDARWNERRAGVISLSWLAQVQTIVAHATLVKGSSLLPKTKKPRRSGVFGVRKIFS
jgi:hypothetical protein